MCVVSQVGDDWQDKLKKIWPDQVPYPPRRVPEVSRTEFEALKKQVEQMRKDLERARAQDEEENNADCEMAEKVDILKQIADAFGVDLSKAFPNG